MADSRDEMRGVLFRNDKKSPGDKKPNFTGKITIRGQEFRLSAWINIARTGSKYLSLAATMRDNGRQVELADDSDLDEALPEPDAGDVDW